MKKKSLVKLKNYSDRKFFWVSLVILLIVLPLVVGLVQKSQENRSNAASNNIVQDSKCKNRGGVCQKTSTKCSGAFLSGYCPSGASNVKCCVPTGGGNSDTIVQDSKCKNAGGVCQKTSTNCSGTWKTGYCPSNASNVKCCVPKKTTTTPVPTSGKIGLKFAVMSDIHNNTSGLKKMMKKAKNDGMMIVVLAGDLTEEGKKSELMAIKKILDDSGIKYETTEGNHDRRENLFDDVFGKNYQSIKFSGIKLILIDNSSDSKGLGSTQKAWIESEVAECKTIICIGIMHMPLNHPTSDHVMGEENKNTAKEAVWLRKLFVSSGVKEIETGHVHHFATYTLNGLKTNQVGPGTSSDFSEFTIDGLGKITRKKITL